GDNESLDQWGFYWVITENSRISVLGSQLLSTEGYFAKVSGRLKTWKKQPSVKYAIMRKISWVW
ncbi:TPA: hypothetical protein ACQWGN_002041, partial [Neisseria subflava]